MREGEGEGGREGGGRGRELGIRPTVAVSTPLTKSQYVLLTFAAACTITPAACVSIRQHTSLYLLLVVSRLQRERISACVRTHETQALKEALGKDPDRRRM